MSAPSERTAHICREWAEGFLFISAHCLALAAIGAWPIGLLSLPFSLAAARLIREGDLAPPATLLDRGN